MGAASAAPARQIGLIRPGRPCVLSRRPALESPPLPSARGQGPREEDRSPCHEEPERERVRPAPGWARRLPAGPTPSTLERARTHSSTSAARAGRARRSAGPSDSRKPSAPRPPARGPSPEGASRTTSDAAQPTPRPPHASARSSPRSRSRGRAAPPGFASRRSRPDRAPRAGSKEVASPRARLARALRTGCARLGGPRSRAAEERSEPVEAILEAGRPARAVGVDERQPHADHRSGATVCDRSEGAAAPLGIGRLELEDPGRAVDHAAREGAPHDERRLEIRAGPRRRHGVRERRDRGPPGPQLGCLDERRSLDRLLENAEHVLQFPGAQHVLRAARETSERARPTPTALPDLDDRERRGRRRSGARAPDRDPHR